MQHRNLVRVPAALLLLAASILWPLRRFPAAANGSPWGANYFPNVELTTQEGKTVRFYDDLLKDKIVAIDLIYTHCKDECPLETARLAQVQRLLGDRVGRDIFFYSISIDPERDTPEALKAYAERYHAGPGWLFLTGQEKDIETISKKLGLYSPDWGRDGHTADLMIGNVATGQWMRNSATDNPRFLALMIGNFLTGWKNRKPDMGKSYVEAPHLNVSQGQYLFSTRCAACHTIGRGDVIGPDLLGVTRARDRAWLARFIKTPDQVLAEGDPLATALFAKYKEVRMPNLRLGDGDVKALIDYMGAQAGTSAQKSSAGETPDSRGTGLEAPKR
jgi:protein SCO1